MKSQAIAVLLSLGFAVSAHAQSALVYIGTRGSEPGQGIYAARFDSQTGQLSLLGQQAQLDNAAWLTAHPSLPVIYSVANAEGGLAVESNVHSFAIDKASGKLTQINKVGTGGRDATHLHLDAASKTLFVANHESSDVTALPLQADGSLGKVVSGQKTYGTGPNPRQDKPEPHSTAIDPISRRYVVATDVGADRMFIYRFDPATRALTPAQIPFEAVPPGSAPRHLTFSPDGKYVYVVTEITAEIRVYRWDANGGRLQSIQAFSAYPADYAGTVHRSAAEITISRDGKFVYASVRGDQDSLVVYAVNPQDGKLTEIQRLPSGGKSPRSFDFDPTGRWMLVMNDLSSSVNVFRVDPAAGKLSPTNSTLKIPNAATVVFYAN